jgi:CubicO group peptidase (beta-lactamase class C family)
VEALRQVETWPASHACAGATTAAGVLGTAGDDGRAYELASVSKLFVAYAALVAAEEGAIELDGPAGPEGSTFRHLLAHASGLGPDGNRLAPPERSRIYSNGGYDLLAGELARHAGMPFEEYLREAVFGPLALSAELRGAPSGGVVATLADVLAFGLELLAPRLVARETLDEATSVQFPGLVGVLPGYGRMEPNDWGLGFELKDAKRPHWTGSANAPLTFGHFGSKTGTATFLWVDRDAGLACAALADLDFGDWAREAWPRLSDAVLAEAAASSV